MPLHVRYYAPINSSNEIMSRIDGVRKKNSVFAILVNDFFGEAGKSLVKIVN